MTGQSACCESQTFTAHWGEKKKKNHALNLPSETHKHEYCHVHAENRDRTVKKTEWRDMPFTYSKMVLKPFDKKVKKTVMVKKKQMTSKIEYETKTIKRRKTVMKSVTRKKIQVVMKTITKQEPQVKETTETRIEKKTTYKKVSRTVKKVRNVLKERK